MKITIRIPTEQYAYIEVEFDNLIQYKEEYPTFIKSYLEMRKRINKLKEDLELPFED